MSKINCLIKGLNIIKEIYDEDKIEIMQDSDDCFQLLVILEKLTLNDETAEDERYVELKYEANCEERTLLNNNGFRFFGFRNENNDDEYMIGYIFNLI